MWLLSVIFGGGEATGFKCAVDGPRFLEGGGAATGSAVVNVFWGDVIFSDDWEINTGLSGGWVITSDVEISGGGCACKRGV